MTGNTLSMHECNLAVCMFCLRYFCGASNHRSFLFAMATRCQFENSNDVGVFAKLTSSYCIVALGGSENFYRSASVSGGQVPCLGS